MLKYSHKINNKGFAGFLSNLYGLATGQLKNLYPTIVILFFDIIWSNSLGLPIWIGILAELCWESVIFFRIHNDII